MEFVVSLLQRACAGLGQASGPTAEHPVESEALSMAMGLVATLLSEPQVKNCYSSSYYGCYCYCYYYCFIIIYY